MKIKIVVDSTFGLSKEFALEHRITVIPLNVLVNGNTYQDEIEISLSQVIEHVSSGTRVTTSQPSPVLYHEIFSKLIADGATDVLCFTISSTLSGTYQAANIGKEEIKDGNVHVIDTLTCSIGAEIILKRALTYLEEGCTILELLDKIEILKEHSTIFLNMENLNAVKLSGRVTRVKAAIGNLLRVKPILEYIGGKLTILSKFRTEGHVFAYIVERLKKEIDETNKKFIVVVSYVRDIERANRLKQYMNKHLSDVEVQFGFEASSVVAINIGYGGIGIAWTYE